ncbi:MAG: TolC family protein, partial [Gemmatimonadetes bacterium]|nr:TolC family protein [Gemmatimonadota bacterium]
MKRIIGLAAAAALVLCPEVRTAVFAQEAAPDLPGSSRGAVAALQVPDSLTLEQAVRRVLETHPAVQEARNGVSASEARVQVQQSLFSPTVVAEGSYS